MCALSAPGAAQSPDNAVLGAAVPTPRGAVTGNAVVTDRETLLTALASVYRSNPRLQAERARLREIDETYVQARAQGRPQVTAGGEASYTVVRTPEQDFGADAPPGAENPFADLFGISSGTTDGTPYAAQLNVVQPIYQGGRVGALKRQAKAAILAARAGLESAENDLFLSAASAYVDVLRDTDAAAIRRNNVRVLMRQLDAAETRFEVGEGTRTDIAQSQARLAAAQAGLAQAEAALDVSEAAFARVVGRAPGPLSPAPDFVLPANLGEAVARARSNNPQLLAAYYNERAGAAAIDVAKAAGRPTVSLNGTASAAREQILGIDQTDQASLTARVSIPIFSGGANRSRVRQAKNARTRLAYETRDTERAVEEAVAQIWAQLQAARAVLASSRRQVEAAEVAFEGVTLEQQVGTRDQLDVLNAEQEVLDARLGVINAQRDVDAAGFRLLAVIGVFDADGIPLPVEGFDAGDYLAAIAHDGFERLRDRVTFQPVREAPEPRVEMGPPALEPPLPPEPDSVIKLD